MRITLKRIVYYEVFTKVEAVKLISKWIPDLSIRTVAIANFHKKCEVVEKQFGKLEDYRSVAIQELREWGL